MLRAVHTKENGKKIRFTMIGQGGSGFAIAWENKEVTIDAELTAIKKVKGFLASFEEETYGRRSGGDCRGIGGRNKVLDLDQYMNNSVKIKLFGKEYDVFEPTVGMILEMDQLEADLSEDNVYEKTDRCMLAPDKS